MTRLTACLAAVACACALSLSACAGTRDDAAPGPSAADASATTAGSAATSGTTTSPAPTAAKPTGKPRAAATRVTTTAATRATRTQTRSPGRTSPPRPSTSSKPRTTPRPSPSTTAPSSLAAQVLTLVNREREKAGCRPVSANAALRRAAQAHSADMAAKDYFSHTSPDGRTFADRIRAAGYTGRTFGENIAAGQATASSVMAGWMNSAGHRANILNCSFTALGVGHATGGTYGHYWTQDFGG